MSGEGDVPQSLAACGGRCVIRIGSGARVVRRALVGRDAAWSA